MVEQTSGQEQQQAQGARGVNPASFCTKWAARSDEEHAAALARYERAKKHEHYLRTHPRARAAEARARNRTPLLRDTRPFSIWKSAEA